MLNAHISQSEFWQYEYASKCLWVHIGYRLDSKLSFKFLAVLCCNEMLCFVDFVMHIYILYLVVFTCFECGWIMISLFPGLDQWEGWPDDLHLQLNCHLVFSCNGRFEAAIHHTKWDFDKHTHTLFFLIYFLGLPFGLDNLQHKRKALFVFLL